MKTILILALLLPILASAADGIIYKKNAKSKFSKEVQALVNLYYGPNSPSTKCNQNAEYKVVEEIVTEYNGYPVNAADMWVFGEQDQNNMSGTDPVSGRKYRIHSFMVTVEKGQKPDMSQYSCETPE